ncbi:MAG: spermidine/putrescine ABC transporter permease PotB [Gammaproteobacteria bacterium]
MKRNPFKYLSLSAVWVWLGLFALIPTLLVLITSFLSHDENQLFRLPFTLSNYGELFNFAYVNIFLKSIYLAGATVLLCLLIGYPFAYFIARSKSRFKSLFLMLVIIPFWTSSLIRTYAIMAILKVKGLLNSVLLALGIIHHPLQLLYSNVALFIGLTYNLLPFMILPLYANIEKLDEDLLEAAKDLGAGWMRIFLRIVLPLTLSGILAGSLLVFLPAMTMFYIPDLLGGAKSLLLGNLIENKFLLVINWPLGAAISVMLIVLMSLMLLLYWRFSRKEDRQEQLL